MPGVAPAVGVTLELGAESIIFIQHIAGNIADFRQDRINGLGGMSFGEDDAVTFRPVAVVLIQFQMMEIQRGDNIHGRHRAAGVSLFAAFNIRTILRRTRFALSSSSAITSGL